ncbi:MAG: thioredoxin-disulfide reductase [Bacteroidales bacterium]|nr:thioredoxin-disulfide reductase [Bacteroidales bacterium]
MDNIEDDQNQVDVNGEVEHVKVLIVGSGPAGYTAAIYAARANLNPVMYEGMEPGGQLTTTTDVENYPGYPEGIQGPKMMEEFKQQAERFGTDVRFGMATAADLSQRPYTVTIDDKKKVQADALIIATGASAKYLGLESEEKFRGMGVSACATCDGFFYKGQDVAVVGGGDSAAEEALYLAGICKKVYMIHRRDELRASKIMQERVFRTDNIEVLWNSQTEEVLGDQDGVTGVRLKKRDGEEYEISVSGFFLAIGHKPNSDIFKGQLDMDDTGYINTEPGSTHTNVEGVFACGDVQDSIYRQAVTAAGSGCQAALDSERYLSRKEFEEAKAAEKEQAEK